MSCKSIKNIIALAAAVWMLVICCATDSVLAKGKVKVYQYAINIYELDNFRISTTQKKKIVNLIVAGFSAWNGLEDVCVKFEYIGFSNAKYKSGDKVNVVYLTMNEDEFKKVQKRVKTGDALAVTHKSGDEFDVIFHGESFLGMGADGLYVNFPGSMANDLQSAMAHEAGHALGLKHSSKPDAVMYKRLPRTTRHSPIENDDIKKARDLYPCPKDSETSYYAPPPEGWSPYGESVAGSPAIGVSTQQSHYDSASGEISTKTSHIVDVQQHAEDRVLILGDQPQNAYDQFGIPSTPVISISDDTASDEIQDETCP